MQSGLRKLVASLATLAAAGCGGPAIPESSPVVEEAAHHDVSPPLFLIAPAPRVAPTAHEVKPIPRNFNRQAQPQPLSASRNAVTLAAAPALSASFEGVGNGFSGPNGTFTVNAAPPDTNGDVGPNHYVQTVNTDFAVFSKTGTVLYGPVPINTLWSGFGGGCQANNDGDPLVIYDPIADRWVISQFSVTTAPYLQCVAVSQTPDPAGAYYRYAFSYGTIQFPDYPKMGVWPDAYYITFNIFNNGTTFAGSKLCAYDRSKMLTGAPATQQCFQTSTAYGGVLPADLDGPTLPPANAPNYMVAMDVSPRLVYWTFHTDWVTPANTTLAGPFTITAQAYSEACAGGACIPQAGTNQQLDSLADRVMYRLAYRNRSGTESLVLNHSITAGSSTGVRWYELRAAGGSLSLFQQGTYAPDSLYRWMGSAAMDQAGNIALGFSVSSSGTKPALHYTARLAGDPQGTMTQGEGTLIDGAGSQLTNLNRWGDYAMLGVDPVDDCTFWFTSEYLTANGTFNWHTRIGSFKLPGCGVPPPANDFSISASPASVSVLQGTSADVSVSTAITNGTAPEAVQFSATGLPSGAGATFNPTSATAGGGSTMTLTTSTATPAGTYSITVTGTSPSVAHSTTVTLTVTAPVVPDFTLAVSPSTRSVKRGNSTTYTVTITRTNGFTGSVSLAVANLPAGATGTYSPNPTTSTSTLTVRTTSSTPRATRTLTITGTSGSLSHSANVSLTVR